MCNCVFVCHHYVSVLFFRRFGFFSYLREMFDAPDEVMSYLCYQYGVHDVPVGNEQTKAMMNTVHSSSHIRFPNTTREKRIRVNVIGEICWLSQEIM